MKHFLAVVLLVGLSGVLWFSESLSIPILDEKADNYFETAITRASVAYATTRAVNASVSVIQHSHLQLEPAGIGFSLALGQVLDPVNDMAERLSDVLVFSIVSLGVQKLGYELAYILAPKAWALLALLAALVLLARAFGFLWGGAFKLILRSVLLLLLLRLLLPLSAIGSEVFYREFVDKQVSAANTEIQQQVTLIKASQPIDVEQVAELSLWDRARAFVDDAGSFKQRLVLLSRNAEVLVANLLEICWRYVSLFVVQILVLPLLAGLIIWRFWLGSRSLFS